MSEIKFKDVANLYLGCNCKTPDGNGRIVSVSKDERGQPTDRVSIFFGNMVATKSSIDGGCKKTRNFGDYFLSPQRMESIASSDSSFDGFEMPGGVTPILRQLSDMDEQTLKELFEMCYESVYTHKPDDVTMQIVQHGSELGLKATEDVLGKEWTYGLTVNGGGVLFSANGNYLTVPAFEASRILLSRHFDLFNLIESSQAISSPALKGEKE